MISPAVTLIRVNKIFRYTIYDTCMVVVRHMDSDNVPNVLVGSSLSSATSSATNSATNSSKFSAPAPIHASASVLYLLLLRLQTSCHLIAILFLVALGRLSLGL